MALTEKAVARLKAPINKDLIKVRPIPGGGKSTYISHQTYTRILNEALDYDKSWLIVNHWKETLTKKITPQNGQPFNKEITLVNVLGELQIDGGRIKVQGLGVAEFTDENSFKKASTDAFRNACERLGIGQDTWKEGREDLYEEEEGHTTQQPQQPQQTAQRLAPPTPPAPVEEQRQEPPAQATVPQFTTSQINRMKDIKEAYNIPQGMTSLDPFIKKWNPDFTWQNLNERNIDQFMDFIEENPALFEGM